MRRIFLKLSQIRPAEDAGSEAEEMTTKWTARSMAGSGLVLGILVLAQNSFSQAPAKPPASPQQVPAPAPGSGPSGRPDLRDPTSPSDKIREKLATPSTGTSNGPAAQPAIPTMVLKGRIIGGVGAPAALLEINGAIRMVRVGNRFSGAGNLVFRVAEISSSGVRIEVESTKEIIVVQ
jgi:hypothetical protein